MNMSPRYLFGKHEITSLTCVREACVNATICTSQWGCHSEKTEIKTEVH